MALYKQKKKKDPVDQEAFTAFCIELGIWERLPDGRISIKPGPLRYTTAEVTRRFNERQKKGGK